MTEGKRGPRLEVGGWAIAYGGVFAGVVGCQVARQARTYQGVAFGNAGIS